MIEMGSWSGVGMLQQFNHLLKPYSHIVCSKYFPNICKTMHLLRFSKKKGCMFLNNVPYIYY